jgi:rhodanese-related sulfurtransferase
MRGPMIKECNVHELKEKIEAKEKIQFIDCREQQEWDEGYIEGATLIPLSEFQIKYDDFLLDKNAQIIIQCRSGVRSMNACMFLLSKGYTNLTNVEGGIISWMQNGFPVITE